MRKFNMLVGVLALVVAIGIGGVVVGFAQQEVTFRVGWTSEIPSLSPALSWADESNMIIRLMFDNLYRLDEHYNPVPELVTKEVISPDTLTWDLTITDKAAWQDGKPLTAGDVVYNFKVLLKTDPPQLTPDIVFIKSVEQTGPYSFRLTMKHPQPIRLTRALLESIGGMWLPPQKLPPVDKITLKDVLDYKPRLCNGPFNLVEWKKDQYLILKANKDYWAGPAHIDKLIFNRYDEESALVSALTSGEVDLAYEIDVPTLINTIKAAPGVEVADTPATQFHDVIFNLSDWNENIRPALLQPEVRKALAHLVDIDKIINVVWLGRAQHDPAILPKWGFYKEFVNQDLKYYKFDIDEARKILKDNGWADKDGDGMLEKTITYTIKPLALDKDGKMQYDEKAGTILRQPKDKWITKTENVELDFDVYIETSYGIELKVFNIIAEAAKQVGIRLKPNIMEGAKLYDLIWGDDGYKANYDIIGWGWNIGADPTFILSWLSNYQIGAYSDSDWHDPEFNILYKQQLQEIDPQNRIATIKRMQAIVQEQLPYIVMYWPDKIDGYSDKFEGYVHQELYSLANYLTFMNVRPKE